MATSTARPQPITLTRYVYTIGWISALAIESAAAAAMLDAKHKSLPLAAGDTNSYVLGAIGEHNIAMACINEAGGLPAHIVVRNLMESFQNVRYVLMVGMGGGIPSDDYEIRLGDIVISEPKGRSGGVVQSDFGAWETDGFKIRGSLNRPAEGLVRVVGALKRLQLLNESRIHSFMRHLPKRTFRKPKDWMYQGRENDHIYQMDPEPREDGVCPECEEQPNDVHLPDPMVHYGIIASGNQVIKNEDQRDSLREQLGACCVEMEAFGLMNNFPCLVVRGISDYDDGRKSDKWQYYAALAAAACAKELLIELPSVEVDQTPIIRQQLEKMEAQIGGISNDIAFVKSAMNHEFHQKVLTWLSDIDPNSNYKKAHSVRTTGTGAWFLSRNEYKDWIDGKYSTLWLYGIPGCGKTVLSATIIENLLTRYEHDSKARVAFFYFDFRDTQKQETEACIRTFLRQLSTAVLPASVTTLYNRSRSGHVIDIDEFKNVLRCILNETTVTFLLFDALDECRETAGLMKMIKDIYEWKLSNVRILATSREVEDIKVIMKDLAAPIPLETTTVNQDTETFLTQSFSYDDRLRQLAVDPGAREIIENAIMTKSNGMFRLARHQLDTLKNCRTIPHLIKTASVLPESLYETYTQIIDNIDPKDLPDALRTLQWLVYAAGPLGIDNIREVLAIDICNSSPQYNPENRYCIPRDILRICSSLVTTTMESGDLEVVKLAHLSVKEYLISADFLPEKYIGADSPHRQQYSFDRLFANLSLAETCLAYLLYFDQPEALTPSNMEDFPLAKYAAKQWINHAQVAEIAGIKPRRTEDFLSEKSGAYKNWLRLQYCRLHGRSLFLPFNSSLAYVEECLEFPLNIAVECGLVKSTEMLLRNGAETNDSTVYGGMPILMAAAEAGGHPSTPRLEAQNQIVKLLIEYGANVNPEEYNRPLATASFYGHVEIGRLLLDAGADIDSTADCGQRVPVPLCSASGQGQIEMVKLLIKYGADLDRTGVVGATALHDAAEGGHIEVIKLLLDAGADLAAGDESPLVAACKEGHREIAKLLLDLGIDPNRGRWRSPLWVACEKGHGEIVRLLLEFGADSKTHGKLLNIACSNRFQDIALQLLGAGVKPTFLTLDTAFWLRSDRILPHLLEKATEVDADFEMFRHALYVAAAYGHHLIVQKLLQEGVDINAIPSKGMQAYGTALEGASKGGHQQLVKQLIEAGADVNSQCGIYGSALRAASRHGHDNVVKQLIEAGADVNAIVENHEHSYFGRLPRSVSLDDFGYSTTQALTGARKNLEAGRNSTALHAASYMGYDKVAGLLLRAGADVNTIAGHFGTALQAATLMGHEKVANLLLEAGADINKQEVADGS